MVANAVSGDTFPRLLPPGGARDRVARGAVSRAASPYAGAQSRRLSSVLAVLALHAVLIALFLLSPRSPPVTPPAPLQVQIITEPRTTPAPPPLRPIALKQPPAQIVVPTPIVSIPNPPPVLQVTTRPVPTASAAVAAAPATAPAVPAAPISPPRFDAAYLHNPPPQYPLQARRLRAQGTVLLRVEVSAAGIAQQVRVEHSSGWPMLDDAALDAVKRWRFEAARRGSEAVAAWVLVPIEFYLRS